jgi:lipopolysaccharide export system permease protein
MASESGRIYSYEFEFPGTLKSPVIYDFDREKVHLERITSAETGLWRNERELVLTKARSISLTRVEVRAGEEVQVLNADPVEYFKPSTDKPSQLSSVELSDYIGREGGAGTQVDAALVVALYRKYAAPFGSLIMALIGIPLALMFGRRSAMAALCVAIALGLSYLALSAVTQNLGDYRRLPPLVAAWSPSLIFTAMGGYLLSRTRT